MYAKDHRPSENSARRIHPRVLKPRNQTNGQVGDATLGKTTRRAFPCLITIVLLVLSVALVTRGLIDARAATDEAPGYRVPTRGW